MGASGSVETNKEKQIQEDLEIEEIINRVRNQQHEDDVVLGKTKTKHSQNNRKHKRYSSKIEEEPDIETIDENRGVDIKRQRRYQKREKTIINHEDDDDDVILDDSKERNNDFTTRNKRPSSFRKSREDTSLPHIRNSSKNNLLSPEPQMITRERSAFRSPINRDRNVSPFQRPESIIPEEPEGDTQTAWDGRPRVKSSRGQLLLRWLAQSNSNVGYDGDDLHINISEDEILPQIPHSASEPALSGRQNSFMMHKSRFTARREKSFASGGSSNKTSKQPGLIEREPTEISVIESPRLPVITENKKFLSQGLQALHNKEYVNERSARFKFAIEHDELDGDEDDESNNNNSKAKKLVISKPQQKKTNLNEARNVTRNESVCSDPISRGNSVLNSRNVNLKYSSGRKRELSISSDPMSRSSTFMSNSRLVSAKDRDSGIETKFSDYGDTDSIYDSRKEKEVHRVSRAEIHKNSSAKNRVSIPKQIAQKEPPVKQTNQDITPRDIARRSTADKESIRNKTNNRPQSERTKPPLKISDNSISPVKTALNKDLKKQTQTVGPIHRPQSIVKNSNNKDGSISNESLQNKGSNDLKLKLQKRSKDIQENKNNASRQNDTDNIGDSSDESDTDDDDGDDDDDDAQSEANIKMEGNTDGADLTQAEIELYDKIKAMRMERDITKNEFGDIIHGYLSKKKDEILSEEKDKVNTDKDEEDEAKKAAELLVQNLHKDKMQITDMREAERSKLQDKLQRRLKVKKQIKEMVANCLKTGDSRSDTISNDIDETDSVVHSNVT